jgi:hypothetical protein
LDLPADCKAGKKGVARGDREELLPVGTASSSSSSSKQSSTMTDSSSTGHPLVVGISGAVTALAPAVASTTTAPGVDDDAGGE